MQGACTLGYWLSENNVQKPIITIKLIENNNYMLQEVEARNFKIRNKTKLLLEVIASHLKTSLH
jgi:hypothetical protein